MVTPDNVREWVAANKEELVQSLKDSEDVPESAKDLDGRFADCWFAGCWLNYRLAQEGCPEDQRHRIGFVMGQRSVFGNAYKWAALYFNEYISNGDVADKPGQELAEEINSRHMQVNGDVVGIMVEDSK